MKTGAPKLPRGRSHPLKPSVLFDAVEAANVQLPVRLTRWDEFQHVFQATYYPAGSWPGKEGDHFSVTCRAVPSRRAAEARAFVEAEAVPQFVRWAKRIEALDRNSTIRREKQHLVVSLEGFAA